MKHLLSILFLFFFCFGFAQTKDTLSIEEQERREKNIQAGNPFKKFGYKPKIHTLSKGKYLEFHDLDSIVKIGSFSYHVKNKNITGYSQQKTKYSEATLRPEIVSRWFSPDPLSDEFPSWSPYNFVENSPIILTDPTGLAPESPQDDYLIRKDGSIEVTKTNDSYDRFYIENEKAYGGKQYVALFEKNKSGLINLPASYKFRYAETDDNIRGFGWTSHTLDKKRNVRPDAVAALLGALHETETSDLSIGQFSYANGVSPKPSRSHKQGKNGDLRPLRKDKSGAAVTGNDSQFDFTRNSNLTTALQKYGWKDILSENNSQGKRVNATRHFSGYTDKKTKKWVPVRHHNHFHLQGFRPKIIKKN